MPPYCRVISGYADIRLIFSRHSKAKPASRYYMRAFQGVTLRHDAQRGICTAARLAAGQPASPSFASRAARHFARHFFFIRPRLSLGAAHAERFTRYHAERAAPPYLHDAALLSRLSRKPPQVTSPGFRCCMHGRGLRDAKRATLAAPSTRLLAD